MTAWNSGTFPLRLLAFKLMKFKSRTVSFFLGLRRQFLFLGFVVVGTCLEVFLRGVEVEIQRSNDKLCSFNTRNRLSSSKSDPMPRWNTESLKFMKSHPGQYQTKDDWFWKSAYSSPLTSQHSMCDQFWYLSHSRARSWSFTSTLHMVQGNAGTALVGPGWSSMSPLSTISRIFKAVIDSRRMRVWQQSKSFFEVYKPLLLSVSWRLHCFTKTWVAKSVAALTKGTVKLWVGLKVKSYKGKILP